MRIERFGCTSVSPYYVQLYTGYNYTGALVSTTPGEPTASRPLKSPLDCGAPETIQGTEIIITTSDAFTIAPPTIGVTITAAITVVITAGKIGDTIINRRTYMTGAIDLPMGRVTPKGWKATSGANAIAR